MNFNTPNHAGRAHALLSASGSHRWMSCPGSALFSLEFPEQLTSKYAEEGTRAHELAERLLQGHRAHEATDPEMLKHVCLYTAYVKKQAKGKKLSIEETGNLTWLHPELKRGTADAVIRGDWDIEVIDLKYGAGVAVNPTENSQLMMYALMALWDAERQCIDETYETVKITIVQPRCGDEPVRTWETTVERMIEFASDLESAAALAMTDKAPLKSGDHCQWCPCASKCPERLRVTHEVIAAEFDSLPTVEKLTDEQISNVIKHKKTIEDFLKSCEEYALGKLSIGQKVPGLKLVRGRGSRDWNDTQEVIEAKLLEITSPDQIYVSGLKSVAQIEKVIGKKAIEPLTLKKEGGIKVALESDKRPEVTTISADDFEMIEQVNLLD